MFHNVIQDGCRITWWSHYRSKRNKNTDFVIEFGMQAECCECLCSALAKPDVAKLLGFCMIQYKVDGIGNIIAREVVD
jgi:hypothetical protein